MASAAKSARKAFGDIGDAAKSGGHAAAEGTTNVRASLGLLDNAIRGAHGAAMADLIHLFQDSKIVMAALPLAATAGGILLIGGAVVEAVIKIREMQEENRKLAQEMTDFGTAAQLAFNGLDQKYIEAEKRADELRNDHLGALRLQLQLINMQSMGDLEKAFDELSKRTDQVFEKLKSHWYSLGIGSDGAKHALEQFTSQYESLLSKGQGGTAANLLTGTLSSAERVLKLQKDAKENSGSLFSAPKDGADLSVSMRAQIELKRSGVGFTEREIAAQSLLVQALRDQAATQQKIADIKKQDEENAKKTAGNDASGRSSAAARAAAESQLRMGEMAVAADRAVAQAQLAVKRASIEEKLAVDLDFADREFQLKLAANEADRAALDRAGKDYSNQLKSNQAKILELTEAHESQVTELRSRASVEANAKELRDLEQSQREQITATGAGSEERLAAVEAAIKSEEAKQLQDTAFYRELLTQRVDITRQMSDEKARQLEIAGKQEAEDAVKMGELMLAAEQQKTKLLDSFRRVTVSQRLAEETKTANAEYSLKMLAFQREAAALDKSGKDYNNKLKAIQDKEKQLTQSHENELTGIKSKAEMDRNQRILAAETHLNDAIAQGLTSVLMRHQSFGQMLLGLGDEIASGMMQNAIKSVLANDYTKESDAAKAARKMFNAGADLPFPVNIVAAPLMGAAAFASVMAFEGGGIVPGVGRGDIVPAMLTPGEGVIPGGVMEGLNKMARSGGMSGGTTVHLHHRPTYNVQTIDGSGVKGMLEKHTQEFSRHFNNEMRKANR